MFRLFVNKSVASTSNLRHKDTTKISDYEYRIKGLIMIMSSLGVILKAKVGRRNNQLRITILQGRRKMVEGRINSQYHFVQPGEPRRGDMIVA